MVTKNPKDSRTRRLQAAIRADISGVVNAEGRSKLNFLISEIRSTSKWRSEWSKAVIKLAKTVPPSSAGWWFAIERVVVLGQLQSSELGKLLEAVIAEGRCVDPSGRARIYALLDFCGKPPTARVIDADQELRKTDRLRWLDLMIPRVLDIADAQKLAIEAVADGHFGVKQFRERLEDMRSIGGPRLGDWLRKFRSALLTASAKDEFDALVTDAFEPFKFGISPNPDGLARLPPPRLEVVEGARPIQVPNLETLIQNLPEMNQIEIEFDNCGVAMALHEHTFAKQGVNDQNISAWSHNTFNSVVERKINGNEFLLPAAHLLRARSRQFRIANHRGFEFAREIIVRRVLHFDRTDPVSKFIRDTPADVRHIVAKVAEYHEEQVIMKIFREIVSALGGPEVVLWPMSWGQILRADLRHDTPILEVRPEVISLREAMQRRSVLYRFDGYHVLARKRWLKSELDRLNQNLKSANGVAPMELDSLDLPTKAWLAVNGGILSRGAYHFGLGKYFEDISREAIERLGRFSDETRKEEHEPSSADIFENFMAGPSKVFLAGATYSHLIKDWLLPFDIHVLMNRDDVSTMINSQTSRNNAKAKEEELGFWDQIFCEIEHEDRKAWWEQWKKDCIDVFRLIAKFIEFAINVGRGQVEDEELCLAWPMFIFGILGAHSEPPSDVRWSPDHRWSIAADRKAAVELFETNNHFGVFRVD